MDLPSPRAIPKSLWCSLILLHATILHPLYATSIVSHSPAPTTDTILGGANHLTDQLALEAFKLKIINDPSQTLASWNTSIPLCKWQGVTCGRRHPERVTALDLGSLNLAGTISPTLSKLTFLRRLLLPNNQLQGTIPPELGGLTRLRYLNLSMNSLQGEIPPTLSRCSRIQVISLGDNKLQGEIPFNFSRCLDLKIIRLNSNFLTGSIPSVFGSLSKLIYLDLGGNNLTGSIPPSLGNLSSLLVLDVPRNKLSGNIPPSLGQISSLVFLYLYKNNLVGNIPSSIGNLSSLSFLDLSYNDLTGNLPSSLGNLSSISTLDLSYNQLTESLPSSLGNLSSLNLIDVTMNTLSGGIPPSLGQLSSLTVLALTGNTFSGAIPASLGTLSSLSALALSHNELSGTIPSSLYNLSSINLFGVSDNELVGTLPPDMGTTLPSLRKLYMYYNRLHGPIPMSLANASGLEDIELTGNKFSGKIPSNLGTLQGLYWLNLDRNQLEAGDVDGWSFLASLTNCSRLQDLQLGENGLGGKLPNSVANLSTGLYWLDLGGNNISGSLPTGIGKFTDLTFLTMDRNFLTGSIPTTIGNLQSVQILDLHDNKLSGQIPASLGNLTQVNELYLGGNALQGSIPASIGDCQALAQLDLSYNKFTGSIPREVVSLSSLTKFLGLSHNSLTGPLPSEVGSLINLKEFDVSENNLSGEIPSSIGKSQLLEILYMEGNFFRGTIPSSMSNLKGLQELDLSRNNLSGPIPEFLGAFIFLDYLNLSFNHFEGEVPKEGIFKNVTAVSITGNDKLCGGNPKFSLPTCPSETHNTGHASQLKVIILVVGVFLFVIIFICLLLLYYRAKRPGMGSPSTASMKDQCIKVSYSDLLRATDGFSSTNLIGVGSYGSVYRGIMDLDGERVVAVKLLNLQQHGASRSFLAECEALRNIRHRNLVKILTACSSIDNNGNDFKALIFEFMSNGSLEHWLHPQENDQSRNLSLVQRLNIAIDVGSALDYLHGQGPVPIAHCDLKPSNVLLDEDMTAHVGDFGLARFLIRTIGKPSENSSTSTDVKGTIGYIPPEYGMANQVSTEGDVYSYGILLLEMFTGRKPVDETFKEGLSLRKYVEMAFPERVMDIADAPQLAAEKGGEGYDHSSNTSDARWVMQESLVSVLRIGLLCSRELPGERMQVGDAINELLKVRNKVIYAQSNKEKREKNQVRDEGPSYQANV